MSSITASDGVTISTDSAGGGPAVLLVHGITESAASWGTIPSLLVEAGYRVITMDLRGHGASGTAPTYDLASMAGDVGAVLAAEGAADALVIGHSLGGAVVSAYAAGGPCRGVVNVDQPLALGGFKDGLAQLEPMLRGSPEECAAAIGALFDQMRGPLSEAEFRRVGDLRRPDQDVVLGVWDLVLTSSVEDLDAVVAGLAGAITVPYLSLHGIDPGPDYGAWLTGLVPTATVEVWQDHGHYPHLVDVPRFVARVLEFDPVR